MQKIPLRPLFGTFIIFSIIFTYAAARGIYLAGWAYWLGLFLFSLIVLLCSAVLYVHPARGAADWVFLIFLAADMACTVQPIIIAAFSIALIFQMIKFKKLSKVLLFISAAVLFAGVCRTVTTHLTNNESESRYCCTSPDGTTALYLTEIYCGNNSSLADYYVVNPGGLSGINIK